MFRKNDLGAEEVAESINEELVAAATVAAVEAAAAENSVN
jgi:hypothetical protein